MGLLLKLSDADLFILLYIGKDNTGYGLDHFS